MVDISMRQSAFASERREYRILFALSFPLFLAAAVLARAMPASKRFPAIEKGHFWSVFADARAAADTVLPYAFMR